MENKKKRIGMALFGVLFCGVCVGILQKSSLGADPFTCFVSAFANLAHSTYGNIYPIVTGILLLGVFSSNAITLVLLRFLIFSAQELWRI